MNSIAAWVLQWIRQSQCAVHRSLPPYINMFWSTKIYKIYIQNGPPAETFGDPRFKEKQNASSGQRGPTGIQPFLSQLSAWKICEKLYTRNCQLLQPGSFLSESKGKKTFFSSENQMIKTCGFKLRFKFKSTACFYFFSCVPDWTLNLGSDSETNLGGNF